MDRLARLRTRSSAGGPSLNASTTSSLAAGYETANDESLTSGSGSMYFSMTEGGGGDGMKAGEQEECVPEEEPTLSGTLASHSGMVDQTLENDFSVEEVSTIRKATIGHASPATVQVAAGMAVKYLGVSSTPAATKTTPKAKDLSGIDQLDQTPSIMKKRRDPKTPAESPFVEDLEDTKVTLDGSGVQGGGPPPGNKSYGTNVLANFFASLDVNSATPEIKITAPEEVPPPTTSAAPTSGTTPTSKRDSNSCENFFESLKKNPTAPAAVSSRRQSLVRKSLLPKVTSIATAKNRVASPISRRSTAVRLIPDKLREMRKTNQTSAADQQQLVQFRRKSVAVPTMTTKKSEEIVTGTDAVPKLPVRKSMAVAAVKAASTTAVSSLAAKRKSVVPPANGRRSVLPVVGAVRRGVVTATTTTATRVALKIPAKTTLSNGPDSSSSSTATSSSTHRRTLLGKRPATSAAAPVTATSSLPSALTPTPNAEQPAAKQRKSLAPFKEAAASIRISPRNKPQTAPAVQQQSRIRPPTAGSIAFKKPETFTCEHCQRIFRLRSSFETHLKTVHANPTTAQPPQPQPSPNKSSDGTTTSGGAGAKCQYCGKGFAGARFLTNHVVANCDKVPLPEKRRLLAEGERERAANVVKRSTPDAAKRQRLSMRPPTTSTNRSASSTRSGDETDTSTCSSNGGTTGSAVVAAAATTRKKVAVKSSGGGGISRTPSKELKCHLCARRFLNAVEYALHVQAHAKNGKVAVGGGGDGEDVENLAKQGQEQISSEEVSKLMQKLVTLTKGGGSAGKVGAALKSSNGSNVGKK
uniref:C2H2-type domain-containing protein n=1 Tax=Culex tarsalis TaxID=7177 RepID=A0A1Q3FYQ9_CULTA